MKTLLYINRPVQKSRASYNEAMDFICNNLKKVEGVESIYRFGNLTTPGISDIDLLIVLDKNIFCPLSGFEHLPSKFNGLFTHGIFAMNQEHYGLNQYYTAWSEQHLVWGNPIEFPGIPVKSISDENALKQQTALEFILMIYVDLKIQLEYGVIKLRSLLQHLKGVKFDLEYLGVKDSWMLPMLAQVDHWIKHWFEETPDDKMLTKFILDFSSAFEKFAIECFTNFEFYLPAKSEYHFAKNMRLISGAQISCKRNGLLLPSFTSQLTGKMYFKIQNKLNTFIFHSPIVNNTAYKILIDRFTFFTEMKKYNQQYLPNFTTLTTSITAKLT